jgi:hypothetical protein
MIRSFAVLLGGLLMTGCAALAPVGSAFSGLGGGRAPGDVHEQTSIILERDNFVVVRTNVFGISKGFSLLGFITLYPATVTKAVDRMYSGAQMTPGEPQTLAHLIIEHSSSYFILFGIPRVEAHADLIAFRPAPPPSEAARPRHPPPKPPEEGPPR